MRAAKVPRNLSHRTRLPIGKQIERGDLRIVVAVEVPKKLSKEQREALERFSKASGEEIN